jgi:hypothetical protein
MTQGQATAIIFLLAAILFVLLVGNSVVKLLWLAFVVLVIVAILWFFLRAGLNSNAHFRPSRDDERAREC